MVETAIVIGCAFALGWFCAITSGALFSYIVFRTKKEQHERMFPAQPKKRKGPIVIDEFSSEAAKDDDSGLPDIVKQMNQRMQVDLATRTLKAVKNG